MNNLACALEVIGRVADAESLCRITLREFGVSLGTGSEEYVNTANNLACLLEAQESCAGLATPASSRVPWQRIELV